MRIVLVGPPGAGKGTQAAFLAKNLSIPHISTGDLFRANISQGTDLGKQAKAYMDAGELVPDEVTIGMAEDRLDQPDAADGFLLDGFPRNVAPGPGAGRDTWRGTGIALDGVLDLEVPEDEVVKRIAGRRICRNDSAHVFHVDVQARPRPRASATSAAASCTSATTTAEDTVRTRLEVYHRETEPIIDYYKQQDLVVTISALGPVAEVTERAMDALRAGSEQQRPDGTRTGTRQRQHGVRPRCPGGRRGRTVGAGHVPGGPRPGHAAAPRQHGSEEGFSRDGGDQDPGADRQDA